MTRQVMKGLTREKLLNCGVILITEQGYHGSGLQGILENVGIPKGSFYNYFSSKEEFSAEVIQHYMDPFIRSLDDWLQRPELTGVQALDGYFAELIHEVAQRRFKGGCLLGNLIGEIGDTSEVCRLSLLKAVRRYRDKLAEGLLRAQADGSVRTDMAAQDMADMLVNCWQGAMLRMKVEQSVQPLEACCRGLLHDHFVP